MNKILENNKENMATLGRSIVKGTFDQAKCEAAVPAIHPGFRLQVGHLGGFSFEFRSQAYMEIDPFWNLGK